MAVASQPLRFAPLPLEDRKIIYEQFYGLVEYLQEATGRPIEFVQLTDYADIIEQFSGNKIDLAYLGPLPFVLLKKDFAAAEPLACFRDASGEASYTCSLVTFGASGLAVEDLKGVHFGLTQPYSTCGYLAVTEMLRPVGLSLQRDGNRFSYAGSHSEAALGVVRGEFEVAGVKTAIAQRYAHLDLVSVAQSEPYPGFTLVGNAETVDAATLGRLQDALRRLRPEGNPGFESLVRGWGKQLLQGTVPPRDCDYSGISSALRYIPSPIPGARR